MILRMWPRRRLPLAALIIATLAACGPRAWSFKGAPDESPDEQFRTGVEVGYDAFLWRCHRGERVLVVQSGSACFGTSATRVERGPCGTPLPGEARLDPPPRRNEIPEGSRWPNSRPESWTLATPALDGGADARP